uniref:Uncharacterized protein n=1 Tax=Lygus hesperus TaxID=30085 RepID=A0A0A9YKK3_LYGHE
MIVLLLVASVCLAPPVLGGQYKIRAPPPPPVPPASIHYGPHPPPHRPLAAPSYIHPYRAPHPSYYPPGPAHYRPRIPYYHKSTPREFHRLPSPLSSPVGSPLYQQPKLTSNYVPAVAAIPAVSASSYPAGLWSNYNAFRAPLVKESFNTFPSTSFNTLPSSYSLPSTYSSASLLADEDKGPIHTIPAPNLGGGPDAAHLYAASSSSAASHYHHHKKPDPESDLVAVLRHGIQNVNVPHSSAYQVTEDPSIHTPEKDTPLHFAPDPDPSTPTLKVPATNDPQSIPSNGQVPLDIYLQKEADKLAASTEATNTLTAQDLFNLLNYQPSSASQASSLPSYNPETLLQQSYASDQFAPQFQTFNYDERTQQGAYGSNSFPTASMSLDLANTDLSGHDNLLDLKTLQDNDLAGSEKDEVFHKIVDPDNEIDQKREEPKKKSLEKKESTMGKNEVTRPPKHPNDLPQTSTKFEIRVPQDIREKIKTDILAEKGVPCPPGTSCVLPVATQPSQPPANSPSKPDDGVQLQKSIQIYSTTYTTSMNEANKFTEQLTQKPETKKARGIDMSEISIEENIDPESANSNLPFGARIRPKRF